MYKIWVVITLLTLLIVSVQGVVGESGNETLQQELDNLTQYLTSQGYEWLINYSITIFIKLNLSTKRDLSL